MKYQSKIICSILLIIGTFIGYGQQVSIGVENKGHKLYIPMRILKMNDTRIFVWGEDKSGEYFLEAYDRKSRQKQIYRTDLSTEKFGKYSSYVETINFFDNKFIVFFRSYNKKLKQNILYAKTYNGTNGVYTGKIVEIMRENVERRSRKGHFDVLTSRDDSKVLVYFERYSKELRRPLRKMYLYNDQLEELFEKEFEEGEFMPQSYMIDNDGSIYYLTTDEESNNLVIGSFDANRDYERWKETVKFEDQDPSFAFQLQAMEWKVTRDGSFTVAGMVRKSKKDEKIKTTFILGYNALMNLNFWPVSGTFYLSLDPESKEIKTAQISSFDQQLMDQFKTARDVKDKKEANIPNSFSKTTLHETEDGMIAVSEQYYHYLVVGDGQYNERYFYGDLIVSKFDKDGKLTWAKRIPKKQIFWVFNMNNNYISSRGVTPMIPPNPWKTIRYFSYSTTVIDNQIIIVFNDELENITERGDHDKLKSLKKPRKMVPCIIKMDMATGEIKSEEIFQDMLKSQTIICPNKDFWNEETKEVVLYGQKGNNFNFSIVKP